MPTRLVLDTNAWLDLLVFEDPACARLRAALAAGDAVAVGNACCRDEWQRVLTYPELALDQDAAARLHAAYDALAVDDASLPRRPLPRCADPDDQKFLELACASGADALLTRDRALLVLDGRLRRAGLFRVCRPADWPID